MTTPSLRTLLPSRTDYRAIPRTWKGDLLAGITVGIVSDRQLGHVRRRE